jgi:pimeloyl-ACP methyl ester carboxylesterase
MVMDGRSAVPPTRVGAELTVDVSAALPFHGEQVRLSATVHVPPVDRPRAALICWAGGSYSRTYWDMHIPGHPGYSFAEHLAAHGFLVVAADHLGVGASSKPADGDRVNFESMSAAAGAFAAQVRELLTRGAAELGGVELPDVPVFGIGHSLGGCLTIVTQARHSCYDAIAVLGFTHGAKDVAVRAAGAAEGGRDAEADTERRDALEQARAFFGDAWDDVYGLVDRAPHHAWLHRPDVPTAVVAADDAEAVAWPRQAYVEALMAGHSATFAAEVSCPVFVGFGDHDVPPVPHDDVCYYSASRDVTLYVLADSAHCHNFAHSRTQLWDRIGAWATSLTPA